MFIQPIPKHLLIHSIIYVEAGESDGWDKDEKPPVDIDFVRVVPKNRYERKANADGIYATHLVFVDRDNSSVFPEFISGSKIVWKEKTYEISDVVPIYDDDQIPHHYELGLI